VLKPEILIAYLKAVAGSAVRLTIAIVIIVAINLGLNARFLADPEVHGKLIDALDWLHRTAVPLALLVVATLLFAPWVAFRITRWRYKDLDATALLPTQGRDLSVPLGQDDAYSLVRHVLLDDPALYALRTDESARTFAARATPLRDPYGTLGKYLHATAAAHTARNAAASGGWPESVLRVLDVFRTWSSPRRVTIEVGGDAGHATIALQSRLATLLPAVEKLACGQRQLQKLASDITARVQPFIARQREQHEKAQFQNRLLDARLQVLRAQVEPHFLYNSLANVQYLIHNDAAAAEAMVGALIDYLRHALPRMREATSTLGEEVALARSYLDVLRIRMGNRLAVTVDVPPTLASHPFPPLLLISLVENAIKHGLEPKPGGGELAIEATRDDRVLQVTVRDTGMGFGASGGSGIGLRNIRETLASLFGESGKLTVEPGAQGGVTVTIDIPFQPASSLSASPSGMANTPERLPGHA
jgi:signal transduction histidine kinase